MIGPASVASPDMLTGIGISADSATGDAAALFSAALSQAVAVGGADASALATPAASTPGSVEPAQGTSAAIVPDMTPATSAPANVVSAGDESSSEVITSNAPAEAEISDPAVPGQVIAALSSKIAPERALATKPKSSSPGESDPAEEKSATALALPRRSITVLSSSPAPARAAALPSTDGRAPGLVTQTPEAETIAADPVARAGAQNDRVASTEAAPEEAVGGLARCEVDPPAKGKSPEVKAPRADGLVEAQPTPASATETIAKPADAKHDDEEPRDAESKSPSAEKPFAPQPVPVPVAIAVSPAAQTIAAETAPATPADPAPVRPASLRTHATRAAQQADTIPGTLPDASSLPSPRSLETAVSVLTASIDTTQPKPPARHEDAPATLLATAAPDPAMRGSDLAGPTLSQQMSAAVVGSHNHQAEFAAHLETLADQIFVHGRDQHQARFMVDAAELGPVSVEVARRAEGVSVAFGTDNEAARAMIADAQPRLVADARLAGLTVSQSRVDTGGHREGRNGRQEPRGSVAAVGRTSTIKATVQSGSDRFA